MVVAIKVFCSFLIVLFISGQGFAQPCSLSSIKVTAIKTGRTVKGQEEREVVIKNTCICTQSDVVVQCQGLNSVEPVDPNIFREDSEAGGCLVNNGQPIYEGEQVVFKFAGPEPTNFTPIKSQISCS